MIAISLGVARPAPAAMLSVAPGRVIGMRSVVCTRSPVHQRREIAFNAVKNLESLNQFEDIIRDAGDSLVVVDIATTWCGPCKMIYPIYEQFSEEFGHKAVFLKLMGDATPETNVSLWRNLLLLPVFRLCLFCLFVWRATQLLLVLMT
jgi:thiol-disulfide isomerase/thioredoxin